MRLSMLVLAVLLAAGCGDTNPTPAGTLLFSHTVPVGEGHALGTAREHEETLTLERGGAVRLRFRTASAPGGGHYVLRLEARVVDAAGFELEAGPVGTPHNEGSLEVPRWVQSVSVTQNRTTMLGSREGGTTVIDVRGDGTATLR